MTRCVSLTAGIVCLALAVCAAEPKAQDVQGLVYEYFGGLSAESVPRPTSAPTLVGVCATFTNRIPAPAKTENFTVRFTGMIQIPTDGDYIFYTASDDASALDIDGKPVVDNGGWHGTTEKEGRVTLKAGRHAIVVLWTQGWGGLDLIVSWKGPGFEKQTIPATALFSPGDHPAFRRLRITSDPKDPKVDDVRFSRRRGFYDQPFDLTLSCDTPGVTIALTLDGSDPASSGTALETSRIRIDPASTNGGRKLAGAVTVRAVAFKENMRLSDPATHTYVFIDKVVDQGKDLRPRDAHYTTEMDRRVDRAKVREGLLDLPTLSIVAPDARLFQAGGLTRNFNQPRTHNPCSVELIYPDREKFRSFEGFHVGAAVQMQGAVGAGPRNHKNSWQLHFENEYGPGSLSYPFFESAPFFAHSAPRRFDKIVLRAGFNDSWAADCNWGSRKATTYLRDPFSRILQLAEGQPAGHDTFVHLYLNGQYWGIYDATERPDGHFMAEHFGGDNADYWSSGNEKTTGIFSDRERAFLAEQNGSLCRSPDIKVLRDHLDIENYLDHKLVCAVAGLNDERQWHHTHRLYPTPGPIRYFNWDFEFSWGGGANLSADTSKPDRGELLTPTARAMFTHNGAFRVALRDRIYRHCFNDGALTPASLTRIWDGLVGYLANPIYGEAARWGDEYEGTADGKGFKDACTVEIWKQTVETVRTNMLPRPDVLVQELRRERSDVTVESGGWMPADRRLAWYPDVEPPVFTHAGSNVCVRELTVSRGFTIELGLAGTNASLCYTLNGPDPLDAATGQPRGTFATTAVPITIGATTLLKARTRAATGEWSALHELLLIVPGTDFSALRFTEIMYHPRPEPVAGTPIRITKLDADARRWKDGRLVPVGSLILDARAPAGIRAGDKVVIAGSAHPDNNGTFTIGTVVAEGPDARKVIHLKNRLSADENDGKATAAFLHEGAKFEFVELKNTGKEALNLTGIRIHGLGYEFPAGTTIAAGQFKVIAANPWFSVRYPAVQPAGFYGAATLKNSGETLALVDPGSNVITRVRYGDKAPWPISADGSGRSLVPVSPKPQGSQDSPQAWKASARDLGSPGADDEDAPESPRVWVNEAMTHTDPPQRDAIELYNPTRRDIDLSGWHLTDNRKKPTRWTIPAGTVIKSRRYRVFYEGHYAGGSTNLEIGPDEFGSAFSLSSLDGDVYVASPDASFLHGFQCGASWNGRTFGRHVNSAGEEDFVLTETPTLGKENSPPAAGPLVITEILYAPASNGVEFVELMNRSAAPVKLQNAAGDPWKVTGIKFKFPADATIPPAGRVLLVHDAVTPAVYRAVQSVPENVRIFPFRGKLNNAGEDLRVEAPDEPLASGPNKGQVGYVLIDKVHYLNQAPWPSEVELRGRSLERTSEGKYGNDPANWKPSTRPGGTPGR